MENSTPEISLSTPITLTSSPPSPSSSSSSASSEFEFTVSLSPTSRKPSHLCPADELFYKGQLLPLHLSPRLTMVRNLLASSSTSSSSDTTATASRDSTGSSSDSTSTFSSDIFLLPDCDSARPSSVTDDLFLDNEDFKKPKKFKYFSSSLSRFSSVFARRDSAPKPIQPPPPTTRRITTTAKQVIKKYVKKVKPLYDKLASKQNLQSKMQATATVEFPKERDVTLADAIRFRGGSYSHSFSGNLRYPRRRSCISSCPSSVRSSPSHSGALRGRFDVGSTSIYSDSSSMEELQSAIQGAIAHCKKSMEDIDPQKGGILTGDC